MPSKGKRTAARQAQISQRRRREVRRTPGSQAIQEGAPPEPMETTPERALSESPRPVLATPTSAPVRAPQLQRMRPYVTREVRRVALLTGLMLLILVVLTLLLRG